MANNPVEQIDLYLLKLVAPENTAAELILWVEPIKAACREFGIDTVREVACFLGEAAHESGGFTKPSENLNYSAERLCAVWPSRFPTMASALPYARNPQKLANHVYANRLGNRDESSGDGWRHRGAGLFELTGRENQMACASYFRLSADAIGDWLRTKEGAARSAGWFWKTHNLDKQAATPGVEDETKVINGGQIGLDDRRSRTNAAIAELLARGC